MFLFSLIHFFVDPPPIFYYEEQKQLYRLAGFQVVVHLEYVFFFLSTLLSRFGPINEDSFKTIMSAKNQPWILFLISTFVTYLAYAWTNTDM